jgi:hydrogenase-4 component F
MLNIVLILPVILALISWWKKSPSLNNKLIIVHALTHFIASVYFVYRAEYYPGYFKTDAMGQFFFLIISLLYLAVAVYSTAFLKDVTGKRHSIYTICLMLFVTAMDGSVFATNLGLSWVFIETTTLVSAVLIYHEQTRSALEASWKYIFICSVGIALAFVGIILLFIAMPEYGSLNFDNMYAMSGSISVFWLRIAFVFLICGFGTKLGLAPLHFWLPDAHSEAPAPVSALLSGALLNTALVPLLRVFRLMELSGQAMMAKQLFILMGVLSVFIAAVFMIRTKNYKRMLAYSSIENMGLATLSFGIGGIALYAGFLQLLGHSLVKSAFFLTTGNVYTIYHSKEFERVNGLRNTHTPSGWLWLIAFMLLVGMPSSPIFISEFLLVSTLLKNGSYWLLGILLLLLTVIIYSLARMSLKITSGKGKTHVKLNPALYLPQIGLLLLAAICGIYLPTFLQNIISSSIKLLSP